MPIKGAGQCLLVPMAPPDALQYLQLRVCHQWDKTRHFSCDGLKILVADLWMFGAIHRAGNTLTPESLSVCSVQIDSAVAHDRLASA